jgi:PelA/Pel-15E family pectate lyase
MQRALVRAALSAALTGSACGAGVPGQELLDPQRIGALPTGERAAWLTYLDASRRGRARDSTVLDAELEAVAKEKPTPAPHATGFVVEKHMTDAWFRSEEARRTADAIVSFQTPAGGWSKRLQFTRPRRPGETWASEGNWSWIGTFDNGATTEQMRFLAGAFRARHDDRYRNAFIEGLEYIFLAQFPSGCWPQTYPLAGSYHDAATFNDDAIVNVLRLLQQVARGDVGFVPEATRRRARASMQRGVDCILASQIVVAGRQTAWGQQHDPLNPAQPVQARAYEHPALAARESAGIVNFLLSLDSPGPRVERAVRDALAWFQVSAICGYEYVGRELASREGAGPLWARFYEIGTNRPLFSNRDGIKRYDFREVDPERRQGYAWYTDEPRTTLRRAAARAPC